MSVLSPVIDYLDLATKHIYLLSGCREYHPVEDIYCEIRNIRRTDESMRVFDMPVTAEGAVPKGGGKYTPRYAIFNNGWTIVPENVDHSLFISGEQITDDGQSGPVCIDTSGITASVIIQYEPPAAEIIRDEASLRAINRMAFNDKVTYNADDGYAGTGEAPNGFQIGTNAAPSNNIADAYAISVDKGFNVGDVRSDLVLTEAALIDGEGQPIALNDYTFMGVSKDRTVITIEDAPTVQECRYYESKVTGYLDGKNKLYNCLVEDLTYVQGYVEGCVLSGIGRIQLSGGDVSYFLACFGGTSQPALVNMGGAGQDLIMEEMWGEIQIENMTDVLSIAYILLGSGSVRVDLTSVTAGTIMVGGIGILLNAADDTTLLSGEYNDGNLVIINETVGEALEMLRYLERKIYLKADAIINGDGSQRYPFNSLNDAIDFAETNGISSLVVVFADIDFTEITLGRNLKNFRVTGIGHPTIDCAGHDLKGTEFYHCKLQGSYVNQIKAYECILLTGFSLNGGFNGCGTMQTLNGVDGGSAVMNECFNAHAGLYHTVISLNSGGTFNLTAHGTKGRFSVADCDHADDIVSMSMAEGHLTFTNTCTDGIMIALGNCEFNNDTGRDDIIDRTSPKTIADYTINKLVFPVP